MGAKRLAALQRFTYSSEVIDMVNSVPAYRELPRAPFGGRSGWDVFGSDNHLGRIALQSPAAIRDASRLVKTGRIFPLNSPHDLMSPPLFGRGELRHRFTGRRPLFGQDDAYDNFFPQASSQWDSLGHIAYTEDTYYQGVSASDIQEDGKNGIDVWSRQGIAGRAVLLDIGRMMDETGNESYSAGESYSITVDELEQARKAAHVEFAEGDILIVRTGFYDWYLAQSQQTRESISDSTQLRAAGVEHTEAMAEYLWDSGAAALASDSPAFEVWPPDRSDASAPFGFLHRTLIGLFGFPIGELWWLNDLARACAEEERHEFFLTSAPLNFPGAIGSPPNALALL